MATEFTKEWVKFFADCGLPDDVAALYAMIFSENRIQKNMLLDLNKEYLRDMGITVMGDVIAILRNAKVVHEKYYRAQILNENVNSSNDNVNNKQIQKTNSKKSTPSKRMLEHLTRKYTSLESPSDVQVIVENNKQNASSMLMSTQNSGNIKMPLTRKKIEVSIENTVKKDISQLGNLKINRVLQQENEGKNRIEIIPKITKKPVVNLVKQAKKRQNKTVFDRLGESSVTSTSEFVNNNSTIGSSNDTNKDKNSSVFSRLGEKTSLVSSTSSSGCDSENISKDQLPYAGVFKYGSATNKKIISSTTMRADNEQKKATVKIDVKKPVSIKKRLGAEARPQEAQNSVKLIKRQPISFSVEEKQVKPTVIKLKKESHVERLGQEQKEAMVKNKLLAQKIELGKKRSLVSSTTKTQSPTSSANFLKANVDSSESDGVSPSKKVRFGKTTHRLIPSTTMPAESTSNIKNYPKLTMIINNNNVNPSENLVNLRNPKENLLNMRNARIGSLNSDKIRQKISISDRIGNKGLELRMRKRPLGSPLPASSPPPKKFCSVRDRLG